MDHTSALNPSRSLPLPSWALTLAGFGLLILLVLAALFWQMTVVDSDLRRNTLNRARMIATIIEQHLTDAALADTTINAVVTTFLRDKARFVDYLHSVDPLQPEELAALARETGLLAIGLIKKNTTFISGSEDWQPMTGSCDPPTGTVHYDSQHRTALFAAPANSPDVDCILIEFNAEAIIHLREKTALPVLLANLSGLPGIRYVRIDDQPSPTNDAVHLLNEPGGFAAQTRLTTPMGVLVVGLEAASYLQRIQLMRGQFFFFAALLLGLGLFFSWLLFQAQQGDLARTRTFERLLAREHEAAALGRATATIAHEVRNPLNAIDMGLQRLRLESRQLDDEQHQLVAAMQEAVRRADAIITELQRFSRPLKPQMQPLHPVKLINQLVPLYQKRSTDCGVEMRWSVTDAGPIEADPDLLAELLENLLRNSIEAQPAGGFVHINLREFDDWLEIALSNGGFALNEVDAARLGEPYFTTKTKGTGLGLALSRRVAEAHHGELAIMPDYCRQELTVRLRLPRRQPRSETDRPSEPSEVVYAHPDRR